VELRARAAVHLQKHRTEYESEWGGIMPDGGTGKTFDDYLEAIRQLGQFASELEVRALARIYNTRALIVPASDAFVPMVFHTSQTKRMLVLWLENKHLEFLRPKGESTTCKDYPEEHWKVTDGPVKGIRVGGSDEASSLRSGTVWSPGPQSAKARLGRRAPPASSASCSVAADTVWTKQAHTASQEVSAGTLDSKAGQGTAGASSVGEHRACEDPAPVPEQARVKRPRYRPQVAGDRPKRGMYVCQLCPFRRQVDSQQHLSAVRYRHCTRHHNGEGLPGPACRKEPYVIPVTGPKKSFYWTCEWCKCGVRKAVADAASSVMIDRAIRAHFREQHPEKPKRVRQQARHGISHVHQSRICKWNAAVSNCFRQRADLLAQGYESFIWPALQAKCKSNKALRLRLRRTWRCNACFGCYRSIKEAARHKCKTATADYGRKNQLKGLARVRAWCRRHPQLHTVPQDELQVIFTLAELALQGREIRMPV